MRRRRPAVHDDSSVTLDVGTPAATATADSSADCISAVKFASDVLRSVTVAWMRLV